MYNWRFPLDKGFKRGTVFGVKDGAHPNGHRGTDFNGVAAGTPVKAVGDGVVVSNKFSAILGNTVTIKVGKWYFGYNHLVKPSPLAIGTHVKSGDVLGGVGTTGSASSGNHLHFTLSLIETGNFGGVVYDGDVFLQKMIAAEIKAKVAASTPTEGTK